jgi:hypothetical protein
MCMTVYFETVSIVFGSKEKLRNGYIQSVETYRCCRKGGRYLHIAASYLRALCLRSRLCGQTLQWVLAPCGSERLRIDGWARDYARWILWISVLLEQMFGRVTCQFSVFDGEFCSYTRLNLP